MTDTPDTITREETAARVAAALREAAKDVRQWGSLFCGSEDVTDDVASDILALIPDAGEALDRAIAEAEARGMERAAQIAERHAEATDEPPINADFEAGYEAAARQIAEDIRARLGGGAAATRKPAPRDGL